MAGEVLHLSPEALEQALAARSHEPPETVAAALPLRMARGSLTAAASLLPPPRRRISRRASE